AFLQRVRAAVQVGNRPGSGAAVEPRGTVGYQGAGPDSVARFRDELTAAGGQLHTVADIVAAAAKAAELVKAKSARRVLLGRGPVIDRLAISGALQAAGIEVVQVSALEPETARDAFFAADVGITGVDYLVA